jgi:hypothetical protein
MCHPGLPADVLAAATTAPRLQQADVVDVEATSDEPVGATITPHP